MNQLLDRVHIVFCCSDGGILAVILHNVVLYLLFGTGEMVYVNYIIVI